MPTAQSTITNATPDEKQPPAPSNSVGTPASPTSCHCLQASSEAPPQIESTLPISGSPLAPSLPPTGEVPAGYPEEELDPEAFAVRVRPSNEKIFDPSMEGNAGLPAITKMHLLKGGLEGRGLKAKRDDMQAAGKFFIANAFWSAGHILDLLKRCRELGPGPGGYDPLWLSRQGAEPSYLLPNLGRILRQLNLVSLFPLFVSVEAYTLYPRRKNPRRPRKRKNTKK